MVIDNPYSPPRGSPRPSAEVALPIWADLAELKLGAFVYRKLQIHWPVEHTFVYSGWNFLQRIWLEDELVWRRISWMRFSTYVSFNLPKKLDLEERPVELLLEFSRGLRIKRFELKIAGRTVYLETNF